MTAKDFRTWAGTVLMAGFLTEAGPFDALRRARAGSARCDSLRTIWEAWTHQILIDDSVLDLSEIGVALPLAQLHVGIVFDAAQDVDRAPEV